MKVRLVIALCCVLPLVGCNAVFDIGDTEPVVSVRDTDGDGVLDGVDNCIDIENPGQEESDGDALGDLCDQCPGVAADSNHDEDLDGRPDGCDACPAINDFDATDNDMDGVGDACDIDSHMTERLAFEPFVTLSDAWQGDGTWETSADDSVGSTVPLDASAIGIVRTDVTIPGLEWSIDIGVRSTRAWELGDRAGFVARGPSGKTTSCTIECTSLAEIECQLTLVVDDVMIQQRPSFRDPFVRVQLQVKEVNALSKLRSYSCSSGLGLETYGEVVPVDTSWNPGFVASPTMRVSDLDIVQ